MSLHMMFMLTPRSDPRSPRTITPNRIAINIKNHLAEPDLSLPCTVTAADTAVHDSVLCVLAQGERGVADARHGHAAPVAHNGGVEGAVGGWKDAGIGVVLEDNGAVQEEGGGLVAACEENAQVNAHGGDVRRWWRCGGVVVLEVEEEEKKVGFDVDVDVGVDHGGRIFGEGARLAGWLAGWLAVVLAVIALP